MSYETIPAVYLRIIQYISDIKRRKHTIKWTEFSQVAIESLLQVQDIKSKKVINKTETIRSTTLSDNNSRLKESPKAHPKLMDKVIPIKDLAEDEEQESSGEGTQEEVRAISTLSESEIETCSKILHIWGFIVRFKEQKVKFQSVY